MLKLYHSPGTRAFRVMWVCEELGVPYEIQPVNFAGSPAVYFNIPFGLQPYGAGVPGTAGITPSLAGYGFATLGSDISFLVTWG